VSFYHVVVIGKGLTLVGSVIEGDYSEKYASALAAKQTVTTMMKREKAPGFAEVIVAESTVQGLSYLYVGAGHFFTFFASCQLLASYLMLLFIKAAIITFFSK